MGAQENAEGADLVVRLHPTMLGRLERIARKVGMEPAQLAVYAIGMWITQHEEMLSMPPPSEAAPEEKDLNAVKAPSEGPPVEVDTKTGRMAG